MRIKVRPHLFFLTAALLGVTTFFLTVHAYGDSGTTGCSVCTPDGCTASMLPGERLIPGLIDQVDTCVIFSNPPVPPGHCGTTERQQKTIQMWNPTTQLWETDGFCYKEICDAVVADPSRPCARAYNPHGSDVLWPDPGDTSGFASAPIPGSQIAGTPVLGCYITPKRGK